MNIFNKAAPAKYEKSRTRTIVTVIGVVLSAAMITAVATFGVSLLNYAARGAIIKYGDWHVGFLDVDSSFVHDRAADKGVSNTASYENIGYAVLEGGKTRINRICSLPDSAKRLSSPFPSTCCPADCPKTAENFLCREVSLQTAV